MRCGPRSAVAGGLALLVISFISETRILAKEGEELGEIEVNGFDGDHATVNCAATPGGQIVQVTTKSVRLIDGASTRLLHEWTPPGGGDISMAAIEKSLVLLATSGTQLQLLDCSGDGWTVLASMVMDHEVACLAICSSHTPTDCTAMQTDDDVVRAGNDNQVVAGNDNHSIPTLAACGLWTDLSIRLLTLPALEQVHHEPLSGNVIPRALCFAAFGDGQHLLCALGDGRMITYCVINSATSDDTTPTTAPRGSSSSSPCSLADRKVVTIGTKPISLTPFRSHGDLHVFAASDRPTVLHANSSGKLLYSNVDLKAATHMTPFPCDADVRSRPERVSLSLCLPDALTLTLPSSSAR